MKVSLNWVKKYVDISMDIDQLIEKIGSQLGAVENYESIGERYEGILIARIISCKAHSNADKLKICLIDDAKKHKSVSRNDQGYVEIVCGAPNVREGMKVAWLPPGVIIPSSFDKSPVTIEARDIRGVKSQGMLASSSELALSDDHSGLLEIDQGNPGDSFDKVYELKDEYIIDIENKMFTHRPDCFGMLGVAREIAGISGKAFTSPDWYLNVDSKLFSSSISTKLALSVENKLPEGVPRFMAIALAGVEVKSSPVLIQTYLNRLGIRPINNVVDATNYMMLLTGQPLHAYDYDKLVSLDNDPKQASIVVREARADERIALLNGKTIALPENTITISSGTQAIGIGGIMGGSSTEVDSTTKNIVLECATFNMYSIRKSTMALGIFTDAATRFTKGQSALQNSRILAEIITKLKKLAGGEVASKLLDLKKDLSESDSLKVNSDFVNERLGLTLSPKNMAKLLTNVEFKVEHASNKTFEVRQPFWRTDIEIPEDIVEEIGRLRGYENLPLSLPLRSILPTAKNLQYEINSKIREILSMSGGNEVLTYSFVHADLINNVGQDVSKALQLSNALSPDLQYYRMSLLPSLMDKVYSNLRADLVRDEDNEFTLFEINKVHNAVDKDMDGLPQENYDLGLIFTADSKTASRKYDGSPYYVVKKYLQTLISDMNLTRSKLSFEPLLIENLKDSTWLLELAKFYEPKRSAILRGNNGRIYGLIGEFRSSVKKVLKLPDFSAGFEIDSLFFSENNSKTAYQVLPKYPKVQQDISLRVPLDLSFGEVFDFIWDELGKKLPPNTLPTLGPVDIYQKDGDLKYKQITLRLWISAFDRTLKTEDINQLLDQIAKSAKEAIGVERILSNSR
jgi:phenylalanyl-tRNA synthetase beta chain